LEERRKKCQLSSLFSTKSAVILPATQHGKMTSFFLDVIMVLLIQSLRWMKMHIIMAKTSPASMGVKSLWTHGNKRSSQFNNACCRTVLIIDFEAVINNFVRNSWEKIAWIWGFNYLLLQWLRPSRENVKNQEHRKINYHTRTPWKII